ncbi:MAG: DUF2589 domain-containing protein [Gammaproteobacteria bacterium]|jgi:hypothetical protein
MANNQDLARSQLGMIPFGSLIGGPLTAAIEAQAKAATTSLEFINTVAKDKDGNVLNVTFKYQHNDETRTLDVPILTIVPVPFIRIDNMSIDFKASISASTEQSDSTSSTVGKEASMSGSASYWFVKAKFSGSVSSKKDSKSTKDSKYAVEYTMDINVHAVQDDMPAGLAKVLNILTQSIDKPTQGGGGGGGGGGGEDS